MKLDAQRYLPSALLSGNTGTAGTPPQRRSLQRSLIRLESGNKGTQLCLIRNLPAFLVPGEKTRGTINTSERPGFRALIPHSRVPGNFEFSRVNKGGVSAFSLTDITLFDPRN